MSVQSACVTRRTLERNNLLSAALPTLAILVGLPPPRTKGLNPQPHFTLQYKTFLLLVQLMAVQSVKVNVGRVGGLSHALTENVQIEGKSDSFPPIFDPTDYNDFDLSKTEKDLAVAAVSANAQQATIRNRDEDVYELEDRFVVITNATYGGSTFETRLKEGYLTEDAQPTVDLITDPDPFMIMAGEKRAVTVLDVIPAPYSMSVCYSIMSRRRMSTEALSGGGTSIAGHERTSGRLAIPADGDTTTLEVLTKEDSTPESEEKFLIALHFDGHTPITSKHRAVNVFPSESAMKMVVVKIVDGDTSQPNQNFVYLCGAFSGELTDRPQAALEECESTELSMMRIGDAPLSDVPIPLKFKGFLAEDAILSDDRIPSSVSFRNVQESSSITLQTTDDSMGNGYNEFLEIKIDDDSECWLNRNKRGERSRFEIVMADNDKVPSNLLSLGAAALTEAVNARQATCQLQLTRRPKADQTGTILLGAAGKDDGIAGVNR